MNPTISPIINVSELLKIYKSDNLIIVDVRNNRTDYEEKHLEGAIFIDLNKQLSEIKSDVSIGGRHPLPNIENFANTLADLGINSKSHVVIYDDKNGSNAAARFWWMLKSIGHNIVQVLNGGMQEAEKNNFPVNSKTVSKKEVEHYRISNWKLPISDMKEVEKVSKNPEYIVIDVRDTDRYAGRKEPIDLIAGHIPGAINIPLTENLDENGLFLPPEILKIKYEKIFGNVKSENVIVHCGSGVTACHTLLAIAYAGLEIPKLYIGSWSEWSRNNKGIAIE